MGEPHRVSSTRTAAAPGCVYGSAGPSRVEWPRVPSRRLKHCGEAGFDLSRFGRVKRWQTSIKASISDRKSITIPAASARSTHIAYQSLGFLLRNHSPRLSNGSLKNSALKRKGQESVRLIG
jgi:hypothetical protein